MLKGLRAAGLTLLALLSAALIAAVIDKKLSERAERRQTDIVDAQGIQLLETWTIGGIEQKISIRGRNKSNPAIVFLHGGPGSAQIGLMRAFDRELEKHFTVVHWDQRGSGLTFSFFTPAESFSKEQFLSDAHEVILKTRERLGQDRVFLVGHSWGSYLGTSTASRYPELLHAYIGIGQLVNALENENESLNFVLAEARKPGNEAALKELEAIGRPPYQSFQALGTERQWLGEFGGAMFYGEHRKDAYSYLGSILWRSPEYSVMDQVYYFAGIARTLNLFMPNFYTLDLYTEAPEIKVPVYFLHGRHDYNTPGSLMIKYQAKLKAPSKKVIWFEQSAHAPNFEEPAAFAEAMAAIKAEVLGPGR